MKAKMTLMFVLALSAVSVLAGPDLTGVDESFSPERLMDKVARRFERQTPVLTLRFDIIYRFLFLELFRAAEAVVCTSEGVWTTEDGRRIPVYMMRINIDTVEGADEKKEDQRVYIHDRIAAVLTRDDVSTLLYVRYANQFMNPVFGRSKTNHALKIYDLQDGDLDCFHYNFETRESESGLQNGDDLARQGREVSVLLKLVSAIYHGDRPHVETKTSPRIMVDMDGVVTPYAADSRPSECPIDWLPEDIETIEINLQPAPEATVKRGRINFWLTSLSELAGAKGENALIEHALRSPRWSMAPLMADYYMGLGRIRGKLTSLELGDLLFD